jgi:hypothetical protein
MTREPFPGLLNADASWVTPPNPAEQISQAERRTDVDLAVRGQSYGDRGGVSGRVRRRRLYLA